MSNRKAVMTFLPSQSNSDHLLLYEYLSTLDIGISAAVMEAVREKYLPIAMIKAMISREKIEMAGIESIVKLTAQAEIIQKMLKLDRVDEKPISHQQPELDLEFNDDWDEPRIESNNMTFRGEN